jgi:prepilin-type N-terminal cleavage/methylation domain-containing protein
MRLRLQNFDPVSPASPGRRSAFTLVEMLVAIAVIVVILTVGLPMFNSISDSHSIEVARNQMSAMLGRSRARAVGLYRCIGVAFFRDTATNRYVMREVQFIDPANPTRVDFSPDSADEILAAGIGVQVVHSAVKPSGASPPFVERYVSMGVIMFDQRGILSAMRYTVASGSALATRSGVSFTSPVDTQIALAVYDREMFRNQGYTDDDPLFGGSTPAATEQLEETWLDANGVTLMLSRYQGTFMEPPKAL